jgi:hypothetical protein
MFFSPLKAPTRERRRWRSLSSWSWAHLVLLAVFLAMLAYAPRAIADDIDPDADIPDSSTLADPSPSDQVLEIPQQCDQDAVASLCDRSSESPASSDADLSSVDAPNPDTNASSDVANNPDLGSVYDYANQNITNETSAAGTTNVPIGGYFPGYTTMSPSPTIVSSGPGSYQQWASGPGSYPQWARGPGSYQQMAPGPGYVQPLPLGYHPYGLGGSFGARPFGGGGHFGHR